MEKMLLIVNPISGGKDKKKVIRAIENGLDKNRFQWDIAFTEYSGHGTILARESDADIVVAVGGDGTVSEVAKGISGTGKTLGIIPCGSGDGLALHLGISRNLPKAVRQLNDSRQAIIDYGTIDGKLFFCTTGVGMDAEVAWEFAKAGTRGLKTYVSKTLSVWRHYVPKEYRLISFWI